MLMITKDECEFNWQKEREIRDMERKLIELSSNFEQG